MNSFNNTCNENSTQHLKSKIACQNEEICKLKKKIDDLICERDNLKIQSAEFVQCKEKLKNEYKIIFNKLINTIETQSQKLKKAITAECKLKAKCIEQQKIIDCINSQLTALKSNEAKLKCALKDLETSLRNMEKELNCVKTELESKNCMINKLKKNLTSAEEENCKLRNKFDECTDACCTLNGENQTLRTDLECTKKKLEELKLSAKCMEEKFIHEQEKICNELKTTCCNLKNVQLQLDEAKCKMNGDECKIKKLVTALIELKDTSCKKIEEAKNIFDKLSRDNCLMKDDLCHLRNKVKELQMDNECKAIEIQKQKKLLYERECQLKQMNLLSEKIVCQIEQNCEKSCCSGKKIEIQPLETCCTDPYMCTSNACTKNNTCNTKNPCNITSCKSEDSIIKKLTRKSEECCNTTTDFQRDVNNLKNEVCNIFKSIV